MVHLRTRICGASAWLALALAGAAGCSRSPSLGPAVQLSDPERSAASFSFPYYTDIVANGEQVVAAFMTLNGRQDRNVVVRRSADAGATWSAPTILNAPEFGDTISVAPKLVAYPGNGLVAVWQARRNRAGQKFILARRSNDFGATWGPIQQLNSNPQSFPPAVAARDDGALLVAFSDERNVERDIFVNHSTNGGESWQPADTAVNGEQKSESIAPWPALGSGSNAWVIWEEKQRSDPHLLIAHSPDAGATWEPAHRVDPQGQPASPIWPALVESGGRLTAVWTGGVVGDVSRSWLWVASSTDSGATWSAPLQFYEGQAQSVFTLAARDKRVLLTWNGGASDTQSIYFNASDDGGATWRWPLDGPQRIDDAGGLSAGRPRIATLGDSLVAIAWQEGDKKIALKVSRDGGKTWPNPEIVIATADKDRLRFPQLTAAGRTIYVLWENWADMTGVRKSLADVDKLTPVDIYVRKVTLPE